MYCVTKRCDIVTYVKAIRERTYITEYNKWNLWSCTMCMCDAIVYMECLLLFTSYVQYPVKYIIAKDHDLGLQMFS